MFTLLAPARGVLGIIKDGLTASVFYQPPDVKTVAQALEIKSNPKKLIEFKNPKQLNVWEQSVRKVKNGHLIGLGWLLSVVGGDYIMKKFDLDEKSLFRSLILTNLPFGTVGGALAFLTACFGSNPAEEKAKSKLDMFVERVTVKEDGSSKNIYGKEDKYFPDLNNDVIFDEKRDKEKLFDVMERAIREERGEVFLLRGVTRCGKTMTAKAFTRELAKRSQGKTAQFWYATRAAMDRSLGDASPILKELLNSETTGERIERLISYAMLQDEPVVLLLDEAHLLIGSGERGFDPNDPNQSSKVIEDLKILISEKLKTKNCKNVYMFLTANSSGRAIAVPLKNRMGFDKFYDRPKFEGRKEIIKKTLEKALTKLGKEKDIVFNDCEYEYLAGQSGTAENRYDADLTKEYSSTDEANKRYAEIIQAGFGGIEKVLKGRPLLQFEEIESIVDNAVYKWHEEGSNDKGNLIARIVKALDEEFKLSLESREWEGEISYYFGHKYKNAGASNPVNISLQV